MEEITKKPTPQPENSFQKPPFWQNPKVPIVVALVVTALTISAAAISFYLKTIAPIPLTPSFPSPTPISRSEVALTTDKTEYEQGESVKVTIINNTEQEVWVLGSVEPFYFAVEGFNGNDWVEIKRLWCPCGAVCEQIVDLGLKPGEIAKYEWDQQESWCTDKPPREQGIVSQQVPAGKYRVKSRITSDLELGFPGTIYSNEFRIRESLTSKEKVVRGSVIENNLGCIVDTHCYLQILFNDQEIYVIYSPGRGTPCLNTKAGDQGIEIKEGDEVEIFGKVIEGDEMSICDSDEYYIRKLK